MKPGDPVNLTWTHARHLQSTQRGFTGVLPPSEQVKGHMENLHPRHQNPEPCTHQAHEIGCFQPVDCAKHAFFLCQSLTTSLCKMRPASHLVFLSVDESDTEHHAVGVHRTSFDANVGSAPEEHASYRRQGVHTHTHIYTYIHTYIHTYIRACMHTYSIRRSLCFCLSNNPFLSLSLSRDTLIDFCISTIAFGFRV